MSHDSRRELYEIFRLNYTKLNIILKKDGAYNGEKCSKDEPTANSEQATTHPCGRTNEPTNVTRTNLQRTSRMHDQFEANSTRTQRNSRQRTRVAVNKIHVACVWRAMCVCVWGCCVRFGSFGGRFVWVCACLLLVRLCSARNALAIGESIEHVCALVYGSMSNQNQQKCQQTEAKDTRRHVCSIRIK